MQRRCGTITSAPLFFRVKPLAENLKPRLDMLAGLGPRPAATSDSPTGATGPENADATSAEGLAAIDQAESAMRKALGLLGEQPRHRHEPERSDPPQRMQDRLGVGGLHRRRFVQDGDVPVTILRRDTGPETQVHRTAPAAVAAPTSSRLQRTEAALAAESAARAAAERALAEAQVSVRDLRTKIGHAELAKNEAVEAARRERESTAALRQELDAIKSEVEQLRSQLASAERAAASHDDLIAEERQARKALEKSLRTSEAARETAEQLVRALSARAEEEVVAAPVARKRAPEPVPASAPKKRGRPPSAKQPVLPELEPEPVKWWLTPAKTPARRR